MVKPCAARKGVIGREDIARMFVPYAVERTRIGVLLSLVREKNYRRLP